MSKYRYRRNGGEWEEIQTPIINEQKMGKSDNSIKYIAYCGLIGCIFGIPGGLVSYFSADAWAGLVFGMIGSALASSLDDSDADKRDALLIFCGSAALVSFGRIAPLVFGILS